MKSIITILSIILFNASFGQINSVKIQVKNSKDSTNISDLSIYLVRDNNIILRGTSDVNGEVEFKNIPSGLFTIILDQLEERPKIISGCFINNEIKHFIVFYPDILTRRQSRRCPYGHRDNIIPIYYGELKDRAWRKVNKGKAFPGGCFPSKNKWYCIEHKIDF
jgi:hypothetical protein